MVSQDYFNAPKNSFKRDETVKEINQMKLERYKIENKSNFQNVYKNLNDSAIKSNSLRSTPNSLQTS